jgi:hypothetical protein
MFVSLQNITSLQICFYKVQYWGVNIIKEENTEKNISGNLHFLETDVSRMAHL